MQTNSTLNSTSICTYYIYIYENCNSKLRYIGYACNLAEVIRKYQQTETLLVDSYKIVYHRCFDNILDAISEKKMLQHLTYESVTSIIGQHNPFHTDLSRQILENHTYPTDHKNKNRSVNKASMKK